MLEPNLVFCQAPGSIGRGLGALEGLLGLMERGWEDGVGDGSNWGWFKRSGFWGLGSVLGGSGA